MKRSLCLFFALFLGLFLASWPRSGPSNLQRSDEAALLSAILEKCAAYCDTLEASSLNVVCREKLVEEAFDIKATREEMPIPSSFRTEGHEALSRSAPTNTSWFSVLSLDSKRISSKKLPYDLRFAKNGSEISESRTPEGENGRAERQDDAPLKTWGYQFERVLFGPIAVLGRDSQPEHDYLILRREIVNEMPTVVIGAVPKPGIQRDYDSARIWVARGDGSIVKIEWSEKSLENLRRAQKVARDLGLKPTFTQTAEYGYRKDGIKYPIAFRILEAYRYGETEKIFPSCRLNVAYSAYGFK